MISKFIIYMHEQQRSQNTIETYAKAADQYIKWYEETFSSPFLQLLKNNIAEYVSYLTNIMKLDASSINLKLSGLRQLNKYLIAEGIQHETVVTDAFNKKIQSRGISPCKVTQKEVDAFRQQLLLHNGQRDFTIATVMAYAGLRISEVVNLMLKDVSLSAQEIVVIGKGNKKRIVDIGDKVISAIKEYLQERPEECAFLFISKKKGPLHRSAVNKIFNKYSEVITPHQLRHFFCTNAFEKGYSIMEVAYQAGHSDLKTTQQYLHPDKRSIQEKANRL